MPPILEQITGFLSSPGFEIAKISVLGYFGLLWLAIIIWVTRDSIQRSNSLLFQTFAILLNIGIPLLGVILYLIIRPGQTNTERYYQDMEQRLLSEEESPETKISCEKCMTVISNEDYVFCPNCAEKIKNTCVKCHKKFPIIWNICPYCGTPHDDSNEENEGEPEKHPLKRVTKK